jgi:hypothetical protein
MTAMRVPRLSPGDFASTPEWFCRGYLYSNSRFTASLNTGSVWE